MLRPRIQLSFVALLGALGGFLVVTPLLGAGSGWRLVSAVLFLAVIASSLRVERVTGDAIAGGVCVYLLIGMLWGAVFTTLELFQQGSFLQGGAPIAREAHGPYGELLYFSYVTVMTIGYGDVLAATPVARMLSVLAALSGQLYLAVFVAGLVGMLAAQGRASRDNWAPCAPGRG